MRDLAILAGCVALLGGSFGKQAGDFAEYVVGLPAAFDNACLFVRIRCTPP